MLIRRQLLRLLITVWIAAIGFGVTIAAPPIQYMRQDSARFSLWYEAGDAGNVPELWSALRARVPNVERRLGLMLADSVTFVITPTETEWGRLAQGTPLWANGMAYAERGLAILKSPRFNARFGRSLPVTAIHEYVHLLLHSGTESEEIPRWLDEGLAQVLADQTDYRDDALLGRAAAAGQLIGLRNMEGLMGMSPSLARQGYAESAAAVGLLESRFGMSGISNLIHELRRGEPYDTAFRKVFGMSPHVFEADYLTYVGKHYRLSLIGDTELWISAAFVALVLVGGVAVFLRRKRTLKKWREEDGRDGEPREPTEAPYTIDYTIIRSRLHEGKDPDPSRNDPVGDKPIPGN